MCALQIEMLSFLSGVTKGPVQKVEILINIITVTFDMNQPTQACVGSYEVPCSLKPPPPRKLTLPKNFPTAPSSAPCRTP